MISLNEVKLKAKRHNDESNKKLYFFASFFSIYLSWIFINLRISPNVVTGIFFLTGLGSAASFLYSSDLMFIMIGYSLWRLHIIIDLCDGEVARFEKKFSFNGAYWDYMIHSVLNPLTYGSICFATYRKFDDDIFLILALFGSIIVSQTLSVKNNYYRAMLFNDEKLQKTSNTTKASPLKNRLMNFFINLLSFEGFLLTYIILSILSVNKEFYLIALFLYTVIFLFFVLFKFILFSKKILHLKRS